MHLLDIRGLPSSETKNYFYKGNLRSSLDLKKKEREHLQEELAEVGSTKLLDLDQEKKTKEFD